MKLPNQSSSLSQKNGHNGSASPHEKVAIIAGNGAMPGEVFQAMCETGNKPVIVGIEGEVENDLLNNCDAILSFGQLGRLFQLLEQHSIQRVLFAGGIVKRPDFKSLKLDLVTIKELPKLLKIVMGGDDSVLGKIASFLAHHNIEVIGVHDAAPSLLAKLGHIGGPKAGKTNNTNRKNSMALAWKGARMVGSLDAGQGCIVEDNRVIAMEGAEGTDRMIERLGNIRKLGRLNPNPKLSVLAKVTKPGQDMRADLPAIGPQTIEKAAKNGINLILVEAEKSIILQRNKFLKAAKQAGISVIATNDESMLS